MFLSAIRVLDFNYTEKRRALSSFENLDPAQINEPAQTPTIKIGQEGFLLRIQLAEKKTEKERIEG